MKKTLTLLSLILYCSIFVQLKAQLPIVDSWIMNDNGQLASYWVNNGGPVNPNFQFINSTDSADVQQVCSTATHVYVRAEGMTQNMGQFLNPGAPSAQNYIFRFVITPTPATSHTEAPVVSSIGVLLNGIPIFGKGDATSWSGQSQSNESNGQGVWNVDAWYGEGWTLDTAFSAHPQTQGAYHTHATPHRLYDFPSSTHSPIVGWAYDGYPIYGPYGYSDAQNPNSAVKRMESGYALRSITVRETLPDGTSLQPQEHGPSVSATHPLGEYIEDYEYVSNTGDLDEYNGRQCITPEFPNGTYAYFVAADASDAPVFPYFVGNEYYGEPDLDNSSPQIQITIPSGVTCNNTPTSLVDPLNEQFKVYPSIVHGDFLVEWGNQKVEKIMISNIEGKIMAQKVTPAGQKLKVNVRNWANGIYYCTILTSSGYSNRKIAVLH